MHITISRIWFRISELLPYLKNSKETSKNACEVWLKLKLVRGCFRILHCKNQKKPQIKQRNLTEFPCEKIFWKGTDSAGKVSDDSPKTIWKLDLSTKFPHRNIKWKYDIFRSVANVAIMQWVTKTWTRYHTHYRMCYRTFSLKLAWFCAI